MVRQESKNDGQQWHQHDHMRIICASLQTIMPAWHHSIFTAQQCQRSKHWRKQDLNAGNRCITVGYRISETSSAEVSRCQRLFWALPVIRTAYQWLHLTGKVWFPITVI